jgi:AAA15 family ATPase/GTPase
MEMAEEILMKIILTIVGFVVTGCLGYFVAKIKGYKEKDTRQEEALKCLLRSNITSKYYVYSELKEIPYYEKENIDKMFEQYKMMGGNSYVDTIVREINQLPIKK